MMQKSHQNQQLLAQCEALLAKRQIDEAQRLVLNILENAPHEIQALEIAFKISLLTQNFIKSEDYLAKLHNQLQDDKKYQRFVISLLEAKEEHFKVIKAIDNYFQKYGDNTELLYKKALHCMSAGKILQAEKTFLECQQKKLDNAFILLNLGHVYKAKGDSLQASIYYKQFIKESPKQCGNGYWSLADLKDFIFNDEDRNAMLDILQQADLTIGNMALMLFAIARVHEQGNAFELSFAAMNKANSIIDKYRPFRAEAFSGFVKSMIDGVTKSKNNFKKNKNFSPIFIVGMPRSGTTLVEQIIASHSKVESTDELQYIERIGLELEKSGGYVKQLRDIDEQQCQYLSSQYIDQVQQYFEHNQSIIIDKNPNNYLHIGLIKTLFPHAKIINVVRNPLDNAMSVFKQYFSNGHEYAYSLRGIGFYWQGYLSLMSHWENEYGDGLYHLSYESLTENSEDEIRKLLAYCQLDFEPQCLTFYRSKRIVLTPSVSQVRQPIHNGSVNSWKKYEPFIASELPLFKQIIAKTNELLKKNN